MSATVHHLWLLLCAYGAGLLLGPERLPWPVAALLLCAVWLWHQPRTALALAAILAGILHAPRMHPVTCPILQARVIGTVVDGPEPTSLEALHDGPSWFVLEAARGRLIVRIARGWPEFRPGDRVEVEGRPRPLTPPSNPGQRDSRSALTRRAVIASLDVDSSACCRILRTGAWWLPRRLAQGLRRQALERIAARLPAQAAGITAALVLGLKAGLSPELRECFRSTGTYHLLAVSGLHLGLVLAGTHRLLSRLGLGRRGRGLLMISGSLAYMAIAGFTPSIVRAGTMGILYALAEISRRTIRSTDVIPAAALLILIVDPAQALSLGFQLSLAAMAGIVFGHPVLRQLRGNRHPSPPSLGRLAAVWRGVKRGLAVSLCASVSTAPLSAHAFARFVPWSPIVSVLMVPWLATFLALALPLAFLPWSPTAPAVILLSRIGTGILALADHLPMTPLSLRGPPLVALFASEAALVLLVRRRPRIALTAALAGVAISWATPGGTPPAGASRVTVLDVGHGLACVIEVDDGPRVLIDAGSASIRDVGRRVIEPALRHAGIHRLDLLVLTHLDADHVSGVAWLTNHLSIARVVVPGLADPRPASRRAVAALAAAGVPLTVTPLGRTRIEIPPLTLSVVRLRPPRPLATNVDSLVILAEWPQARVLVPGDQEARAVAAWISATGQAPVDLLVLPHHGRPQPGLDDLLRVADPELAVASRGGTNARDGRSRTGSAVVASTRESGAILVDFGPTGVSWRGWRMTPAAPANQCGWWPGTLGGNMNRGQPLEVAGLALPASTGAPTTPARIRGAR